jgi:hypothetical protein
MNDDLRELEHVLRGRAAEVPYHQDVPSTMLVRARRRVVRNALAAVVAAAVIVVGASAGLAGLGALRGPDVTPEGPSGIHPSPSPAPASSCTATDLRATAALQGAAGSVLGAIDLTNISAGTCTLQGRPLVTIFSSPGHEVSVGVVAVPPQWQVDGTSRPSDWPVVRLRPGSTAAIRVRWFDQCPELSDTATWSIGLTTGGSLEVSGVRAPPCLGTATQPTLEVGPFEPSAEG